MRILHYSLGFPPYRTGGLTRYCVDLMASQRDRGHEVALIWPGSMGGRFGFLSRRPQNGVASIEMRHPLPVPYDEGVVAPPAFMEGRSYEICRSLLEDMGPEFLHVHSTMGLPIELVEAARDLNVRTVFSTHDYYPLCPRVTMFREGAPCKLSSSCEACPQCNARGLSLEKIRLLQSSAYRRLKDSGFVKALRARHRSGVGVADASEDAAFYVEASAYAALRERNLRLLGLFDIIHANSALTASYYGAALPKSDIRIIALGHLGARKKIPIVRSGDVSVVRFGYMGPANFAKGYYMLIDALDMLWADGNKFELDLYGPIECDRPYAHVHPRYSCDEMDSVYADIDLALVPSLWPETFGFSTVEAMSRGIPVAVSSMVGAKDLVAPGMGIVFEPDARSCANALRACFDDQFLKSARTKIISDFVLPQLEDVEVLYREVAP